MTTTPVPATFEGIYDVSEAARYLHADMRIPEVRYKLHASHLIRWIHFGLADPALAQLPGKQILMSFEDMISMRVIAFLRALDYSFDKIREAEVVLRNVTRHPRPFATEQIWAEEKGALHIFAEIGKLLMIASSGRQLAFAEMVKENLIDVHGLTFNLRGVANTWKPHPDVLLNPKIQFGAPCITNTRIPTTTVKGMVDAGDAPAFVAKVYGIDLSVIRHVLEWEERLAVPQKNPNVFGG